MTTTHRHQHAPGSGPEPEDICKHCDAELTWTGPSAHDFISVDDQSRTVTPFPHQGRTRIWAGTAGNHDRVEHARPRCARSPQTPAAPARSPAEETTWAKTSSSRSSAT